MFKSIGLRVCVCSKRQTQSTLSDPQRTDKVQSVKREEIISEHFYEFVGGRPSSLCGTGSAKIVIQVGQDESVTEKGTGLVEHAPDRTLRRTLSSEHVNALLLGPLEPRTNVVADVGVAVHAGELGGGGGALA